MVDELTKKLTLTKIDANLLEDELKVHIHEMRHSDGRGDDLMEKLNEVDSKAAGGALLMQHVLQKKLTFRVEREQAKVKRDITVTDTDIYK